MLLTILYILAAAMILMVVLRLGYSWGRSTSEEIMKEYLVSKPWMDGMELVEIMFPEKKISSKKIVINLKSEALEEEAWQLTGPRLN